MLVLTRKADQEIVISDHIRVKVLEVRGNQVRLGIVAPKEISVHRAEVQAAVGWALVTPLCENPKTDGQGAQPQIRDVPLSASQQG
jgi:carbon storage regulator